MFSNQMFACCSPIQTIIFLTFISLSLNSNVHHQRSLPPTNEETIFSEVIRNISRVNNVLQDLIQNYETLQKLYESKSFEQDYSTDVEIDEVFKGSGKKNPRTNKDSTGNPLKKVFPATAMIVSEENNYESDSSNGKNTKVKMVEKDNTNEESKSSTEEDLNKNTVKNIEKKKFNNLFVGEKSTSIVPLVGGSEKSTNNTTRGNKRHKSKRKKHITKDKVNDKENNDSVIINETMQVPSKNVQKIIQSESFPSGKIWDEIANKKPINLKTHKNFKDIEMRRFRFRSKNSPKTALVIVAQNPKKQAQPDSLSSDSEEEDNDIKKEFVKANILRHAYGEACTKLVVRKCHKACKKTRKIVCKMFKCKSALKHTFKKSAKAECIKQFRPVAIYNNTTFYTKMKNRLGPEFKFYDATREGFPAEACYPFMKPLERSIGPTTTTKVPETPYDSEMNILRDRYERACQKASSAKCKRACLNAYKTTCDTYVCEKGKKKAFKKQCKKQCKLIYRYKSSSSSSSGSSSDKSEYEDDSDAS